MMQRAVEQTLEEIGAGERPRLLVLNKVDLLDETQREELRLRHPDGGARQRRDGEGLEQLGERIEQELRAHAAARCELLVPYADGGSLAELHELAGELDPPRTPRRACASTRWSRPPGPALRALRGAAPSRAPSGGARPGAPGVPVPGLWR